MKSEIEWHKIEDKRPQYEKYVLTICENKKTPVVLKFNGIVWKYKNWPVNINKFKVLLWAEMPENPLVNAEIKKELIWKHVDMFDPPVDKWLLLHFGSYRTKFGYFNGKCWNYDFNAGDKLSPTFWAEIPHPE